MSLVRAKFCCSLVERIQSFFFFFFFLWRGNPKIGEFNCQCLKNCIRLRNANDSLSTVWVENKNRLCSKACRREERILCTVEEEEKEQEEEQQQQQKKKPAKKTQTVLSILPAGTKNSKNCANEPNRFKMWELRERQRFKSVEIIKKSPWKIWNKTTDTVWIRKSKDVKEPRIIEKRWEARSTSVFFVQSHFFSRKWYSRTQLCNGRVFRDGK